MAATRWITVALIGIYVLMNTLEALTMTIIRASGDDPAGAPSEQYAFFLSLPWGVIALAWGALLLYVVALSLLAFRRAGATRILSVAVVIDIGGWLWARTATAYTEVFSATEQALEALLFLVLISIIVLMIIERQRDSLT